MLLIIISAVLEIFRIIVEQVSVGGRTRGERGEFVALDRWYGFFFIHTSGVIKGNQSNLSPPEVIFVCFTYFTVLCLVSHFTSTFAVLFSHEVRWAVENLEKNQPKNT